MEVRRPARHPSCSSLSVTPEARAAQRPLENTANNLAPAGQSPARLDYRAERWAARGALWHLSSLDRVRSCGHHSVLPDGSVQVRSNGAAVGYAGLASCGSVWACPVCNAKVQAVRRLEVGTVLAWGLSQGGAAFGAYTVRHHRGQDLDTLWRALSACWEAVARDKSVRTARANLGLVGTIRAAEVTVGGNGWHPHLHPVHLFGQRVSDGDVAVLHRAQYRAWSAAAQRLGLTAPRWEAQDLHRVTGQRAHDALGEYFTKASYEPDDHAVSWEMTSTQTKSRTRAPEGRTPWDLLHAVHREGDADALDLWREWERGSKGKRALTWSRGLRKLAGLDREAADEEIAEAEVGTAADAGFVITDWSPVRESPRLGGELLSAIKRAGWLEGRRFCADHGINIREVGA